MESKYCMVLVSSDMLLVYVSVALALERFGQFFLKISSANGSI